MLPLNLVEEIFSFEGAMPENTPYVKFSFFFFLFVEVSQGVPKSINIFNYI